MLYIKTNDGIFEVIKTYLDDFWNKSYLVASGREYLDDWHCEVHGTAENPEELIDATVLEGVGAIVLDSVKQDGTRLWKYAFDSSPQPELFELKPEDHVYGAIWVDGKGLLYAMRYNKETGKFELPAKYEWGKPVWK